MVRMMWFSHVNSSGVLVVTKPSAVGLIKKARKGYVGLNPPILAAMGKFDVCMAKKPDLPGRQRGVIESTGSEGSKEL